jgi:hypothetical protein
LIWKARSEPIFVAPPLLAGRVVARDGVKPGFLTGEMPVGMQDLEIGLERPSFHGITALSRRSCGRGEAAFLMTECNQESFSFTAHFSRGDVKPLV